MLAVTVLFVVIVVVGIVFGATYLLDRGVDRHEAGEK